MTVLHLESLTFLCFLVKVILSCIVVNNNHFLLIVLFYFKVERKYLVVHTMLCEGCKKSGAVSPYINVCQGVDRSGISPYIAIFWKRTWGTNMTIYRQSPNFRKEIVL